MANAVKVKKSTITCYILRVCGVLVCYLPISCVVFAKTKGKMALFSHLWYFTLTRLSASILITNQILHPFKQSALAIPMIKHVLKMTETHEVKSHLKSASFSIDEGRTSRLSRTESEPHSELLETDQVTYQRQECLLVKRRQQFFKGAVYTMVEEAKDAFLTSYRMVGTGDFYSTLVANCFFNAFLLFTALVLNVITIQALRKISSFPKPLKTLLLSLAVSDLGVGLLVQPLYIAHLIMNKEQSANRRLYYTVYTVQRLFGNLLCAASFFGIIALTVDRFLAIHLHLRYQELVTHRRVVTVVISVWVWSSCLSLFVLNSVLENVQAIINATIGAVCLTTTGLIYCKIYSVVRHHTNQIHALQLQPVGQNQNGELANAARLKKTALATFYVYVVFVVCFLPFICVKTAYRIYGESELRLHLLYYSSTLMFLNSSLNPLIYCWKMRNIRQAVISVLRNIFQGQ
ncbi:unnamed protein product [Porites lobata]|uniref:G-protein coupled receptors family 1 profile domain-containing protein n=1 Tax=Porites lobata TaxID=104759 RepID=A0ABN8NI58_9CNID|nr:unnamed protein product [Porites lobata]